MKLNWMLAVVGICGLASTPMASAVGEKEACSCSDTDRNLLNELDLWRNLTVRFDPSQPKLIAGLEGELVKICDGTCVIEVVVQKAGNHCEAVIPYCRLCMKPGSTATFKLGELDAKRQWQALPEKDGPYRFVGSNSGRAGMPPRGIEIMGPFIAGKRRFENPMRISDVQFSWKASSKNGTLRQPVWPKGGLLHEANVWRTGQGVEVDDRICTPRDPIIVNTAN